MSLLESTDSACVLAVFKQDTVTAASPNLTGTEVTWQEIRFVEMYFW